MLPSFLASDYSKVSFSITKSFHIAIILLYNLTFLDGTGSVFTSPLWTGETLFIFQQMLN